MMGWDGVEEWRGGGTSQAGMFADSQWPQYLPSNFLSQEWLGLATSNKEILCIDVEGGWRGVVLKMQGGD
jgi:hypothetical protein